MAIVQTPTTRILYVAYDTDCDGQTVPPSPATARRVFKSVMKAYDIGQDFAPRWLFTLRSDGLTSRPPNADTAETGSCNVENDFSAAMIAGGIANVGFFFYRQPAGDACSTDYVGWVSPGVDFTTGVNFVNVSNNPFPYQEHGESTLTDYTSGMRTWLPGFAVSPGLDPDAPDPGRIGRRVQHQPGAGRFRAVRSACWARAWFPDAAASPHPTALTGPAPVGAFAFPISSSPAA